MPNPAMRAARPPVTTDADGNRIGPRAVAAPGKIDPFSVQGDPPPKAAPPAPAPQSAFQRSQDNQEAVQSAIIDKYTQ